MTPSALTLMVANLMPLYLVISGQWSLAPVILLFWLENLIIGILNIVKMLTCTDGDVWKILLKLYITAFFIVHYGMFTLGHGVIIVDIFAQQELPDGVNFSPMMALFIIEHFQLMWPALLLLASHFISLISNYYLGGEYRRVGVSELMAKPYGRVVILHLAILIGGLIAQALGQPVAALVLLVVLKISIDLAAHKREHQVSTH